MRTSLLLLSALALTLSGCKKGEGEPLELRPKDLCPGGGGDGELGKNALPTMEQLTTDDDVKLIAEFLRASGGLSRPGIVLVHDDPCISSRKDWPRRFSDGLLEHDYNVVALDRRGAGNSAGDPREAGTVKGALDIKAAVEFLSFGGSNILILVGAGESGTAAVTDYIDLSWTETTLQRPDAYVMLGAGEGTEANTSLSVMPVTPALWVYEEAERGYIEDIKKLSHSEWEYQSYPSGQGMDVFDENDTARSTIDRWIFDEVNKN